MTNEKKIYTIEDLAQGRVAVKNDSALINLQLLLEYTFPKDRCKAEGSSKYYFASKEPGYWTRSENSNGLPAQSIHDFCKSLKVNVDNAEQKEEWVPKWGEEVDVSVDDDTWNFDSWKYVGINPCRTESDRRHIVSKRDGSINQFKFVRYRPAIQLTMQQIAEKFGYSEDKIVITDYKQEAK